MGGAEARPGHADASTGVSRHRVASILPPREGFGPQSAGAIALLTARLAKPDAGDDSSFETVILGGKQSGACFPLPFHTIADTLWPPNPDARYANGCRRAIEALKPQLIEIHNKPDLAFRLAQWFPPRRMALFLHNDPRTMRGAKTARERAGLARRLGRVVCVSAFLARCWEDGISHAPRPTVQPNCLDLAVLPEPFAPEARDKIILFVGRLVANKGADSFVAACGAALPHLPGWRAAMIGADRSRPDSPETPFTRNLGRAAAAAGVGLLGYRDHAAVMAALSRAAIAVVPSRWQEPFGLAALEAMACGAALVTTRRGGLADLTEGVSVAIDPDDPAGMARALMALAEDPLSRATFARAGLERARDYDVPAARRRLDQLRTELLIP
jgi:glycosyltransferase involved in cell wall biosynthesis